MNKSKNQNVGFYIIILFFALIILFISYSCTWKRTKPLFEGFSYQKSDEDLSNDDNYAKDNNGFKEPSQTLTYYRCPNKELGFITRNIFEDFSIKYNDSSKGDWDIYVPCGYNAVESELKKIEIDLNNNPGNDSRKKYVFGINGCDMIVSKNQIWKSLCECYGRSHASTLMPESWVLDDDADMDLFREFYRANPDEMYILKKNVQRKEGLMLTNKFSDIVNAKSDDFRVVQRYTRDVFLVYGRKVNLRVYLLVVIKDGQSFFYVSNIGKCIYTNKKYNPNNTDFENNITSFQLDMSVYNTHPRTFDDLRMYINKEKHNGGDLLFNRIDELMKEVCGCLTKNLYQSKNIGGTTSFQLFGADVIFDNNLHPYLLEFNKGPDMTAKDSLDEAMKKQVQLDMFKTVGFLPENRLSMNGNNSFYLVYRKF